MKRLATLIVLLLCAAATAQPTSQTNERLAEFLRRRPQADRDRDGVLTIDEFRAFQQRVREHRERNQPRDPDHANVAYGEHERHVIDLYLADSDTPAPLVIYIHGGGFTGGSKDRINGPMVDRLNDAGVSVAAINYRFITTDPFPAPYDDAARAIQFLRYHADDYNLDPTRFACTGGSAGAGTSLYLAFHDDMADPDSDDPIARESTRIVCAQVNGAQVSYDVFWWESIGLPGIENHPSVPLMYQLSEDRPLDSPEVRELMRRTAPINYLTADDPPVMLVYNVANKPVTEETTRGELAHHPKHGIVLKQQMDELGIECIVVYPDGPEVDTDPVTFLIERLGHGR